MDGTHTCALVALVVTGSLAWAHPAAAQGHASPIASAQAVPVVPATQAAQSAQGAQLARSAQATQSTQAGDVQQVRDELDRLKRELDAMREAYEQRIAQLEQRIGELAPAAPAEPAAAEPVIAAPQPVTTANVAGASKGFNPDTSVITNFLGAAGQNPMSDQPSLQLEEAEVSMQSVVDPYGRADIYLAVGPDGIEIEEGFLTFTSLPAGLLLKVGKMRADFGKVNTLHTHAMPTTDRPLVTDNLVGGEEGLSDSGFSLSKLLPNNFMYLEATGEVFSSHSAAFSSSERSELTYVGRARGYRDLTEGTNLEFGGSFAFGPGNLDTAPAELLPEPGTALDKRLIGFDASFRYRPLRRAIYKRLNLRTELIWSRQDLPSGSTAEAFGFYGLGEYQFARRWYAGARIDRSDRTFEPELTDTGGSVFLTYWPSEFSQIRGQYRHTRYGEGIKANEFLFQFNFAIGAHGAHVF